MAATFRFNDTTLSTKRRKHGASIEIVFFPKHCHPKINALSPLLWQIASQVLSKLVGLVNRPDAKDEDSLLVTENAVAAIGTLCVSPILSTRVDRSRLLSMWLANLPLKQVPVVEAVCRLSPSELYFLYRVLERKEGFYGKTMSVAPTKNSKSDT